jgi:hypothetical protein
VVEITGAYGLCTAEVTEDVYDTGARIVVTGAAWPTGRVMEPLLTTGTVMEPLWTAGSLMDPLLAGA